MSRATIHFYAGCAVLYLGGIAIAGTWPEWSSVGYILEGMGIYRFCFVRASTSAVTVTSL